MSSSVSSHCWVCDDHGGLYMLREVGGDLCSRADRASSDWVRVDSGFKSIYAGYEGLVCGVKESALKESALYIRRGVTCNNPMGTDWVRCECDVLKAMAGRHCVVRKSSKGHLYGARVGSCSMGLLDWRFIPLLDESRRKDGREREEVFYRYVIDDKDRLFGIASSGEVSYCQLLQTNDLHWNLVTGPPSLLTRGPGLAGWVASFWRPQDSTRDWVGKVSFGAGALWCLKERGNQVWQLVIGQLKDELKVNWVRTELPLSDEEEIVDISACKASRDGLYLIVKMEGAYRMVSCSLGGESCDRVDIKMPVRYPCYSMAICSTTVEKPSLGRKRGLSGSEYRGPLPKKARDDDRGELISGVEIKCTQFFFMNNHDLLDVITQEDVNAEFHYDFLLEHQVLHYRYE